MPLSYIMSDNKSERDNNIISLNCSADEQQLNLPARIGEVFLNYLQSNEPLAMAIRKCLSLPPAHPEGSGSEQNPTLPTGDGNCLPLTRLDEWMDNQDVMRLLHVSARTLQTLRSNGSLPYAKMRGKIYYKQHDVQRLMENAYLMGKIINREPYGSSKR